MSVRGGLRAALVAGGISLASSVIDACTTPPTTTGTPPGCANDLDCGAHRYCTDAYLCRTDCIDDVDCLAVGAKAQCNSHGRCVPPVTTIPDAASTDAAPTEGGAGP